MDPFTLITGVAGLISLAIEVTKITTEFVSSVKDAPKSISELLQEVTALKTVLEQLDGFLKTQDVEGPFVKTSALVSTTQFCQVKLKELYEKLRRLTEGGKLRRGLHALTWPYKEKDNNEIILSLHRCVQTFQLGLTVDQCALLSQTMDKVEETFQLEIENLKGVQKIVGVANEAVANSLAARQAAVELLNILNTSSQEIHQIHDTVNSIAAHEQNGHHKEVLRWLTPISPAENQNDAQKQRVNVTGEWLLETDDFTEWRDECGSLLWLYGIAGCGKTIICSTVVHYLQTYCPTVPGCGLAYFYFDFADRSYGKGTAEGFLRSVIKQLSVRTLHVSVERLYEEHNNGLDTASFSRLRETLSALFESFSTLFIVVDALDESSEWEEVLELVSLMNDCGSQNARIMVTSRPETQIGECLTPLDPFRIDMEDALIRDDVEQYIDERISRSKRLKNWCRRPAVDQKIRSTLLKGANGMFRWVACHLDGLEKCVTLGALHLELDHLPPGLDKTYERILRGLHPGHKAIAVNVLQWLLFSRCPMTIEEVADALATDVSAACQRVQSDRSSNELSDPSDILYICSSLVKVVDRPTLPSVEAGAKPVSDSTGMYYTERKMDVEESTLYLLYDTELNHLQLAHSSVRDYLLSSSSILDIGSPKFEIESNMQMAEVCVAYLLEFSYFGALKKSFYREKPLAVYAARFWSIHALRGKGCSNWETLLDLSSQLLRPPHEVYLNWLRLDDQVSYYCYPQTNRVFNNIPPPLHLMAKAGLIPLIQMLLDNGADPDASKNNRETALHAAAFIGSLDIVNILLARGASIRGSGMKISISGDHYETPLAAAAGNGHLGVAQRLIAVESGIPVYEEDRIYLGKALSCAAENGQEACVALLLQYDPDITASTANHATAVHAALFSGNTTLMRQIIKRDPDIIHVEDGCSPTLLSEAIYKRSVDAVKILLNAGVDVEALDSKGCNMYKDPGNALSKAAFMGNREIVDILLGHGADINRKSGSAGSALGSAIYHEQSEIAQHLLEQGADPNASPGELGSVVALAMKHGDDNMLRLLIDKGANVKVSPDVLAAAAEGENFETVQMLLNLGAGSLSSDGLVKTLGWALQNASYNGHLDVVRLLLDEAIDPDIGHIGNRSLLSPHFGSPLVAAASAGNLDTARLLINRGANVNYAGVDETPLSSAVSDQNEDMVAYLLRIGAKDSDAVGYSSLPAAARSGSKQIVQSLLQHGTHVDVKDERGKTALHQAAEHGHTEIANLLLRNQADAEMLTSAVDDNGHTALHIASVYGHTKTALTILQNGQQDIDLKNLLRHTALSLAAATWNVDLVEELLARGASAQSSSLQGSTVLHMAVAPRAEFAPSAAEKLNLLRFPRKEPLDPDDDCKANANRALRILEALIRSGCPIDALDDDQMSPLLELAGSRIGLQGDEEWEPREEYDEIMQFLIGRGAQIDRRDACGRTVMHHTARHGLEIRMRWLLRLDGLESLDWKDNEGKTPLSLACENEQQMIVRLLLNCDVDLDAMDNDGWTLLGLAAPGSTFDESVMLKVLDDKIVFSERKQYQCVKALVEYGADPRMVNGDRETLLHRAVAENNFLVSKLLVENYNLDCNARDNDGNPVLLLAAEHASPKLVKYLLDHGSRSNARDLRGSTTLHAICSPYSRQPVESISILLRYNTPLNVRDKRGGTALHEVAERIFRSQDYHQYLRSMLGIGRSLIAHGALTNILDFNGCIPLDMVEGTEGDIFAVKERRIFLRILIEAAPPSLLKRRGRGNRLLLQLAEGNHSQEISLLLQKGADVHTIDRDWQTPLGIAASYGQLEVARLLLAEGAEVNWPDNQRWTSLYLAALRGWCDIVEVLLEHGSDVGYWDRKRRTPLHAAMVEGHEDVVRVLLERGADVEARDREGLTPLDYSVRYGWEDVGEMLLARGARYREQALDASKSEDEKSQSEDAFSVEFERRLSVDDDSPVSSLATRQSGRETSSIMAPSDDPCPRPVARRNRRRSLGDVLVWRDEDDEERWGRRNSFCVLRTVVKTWGGVEMGLDEWYSLYGCFYYRSAVPAYGG